MTHAPTVKKDGALKFHIDYVQLLPYTFTFRNEYLCTSNPTILLAVVVLTATNINMHVHFRPHCEVLYMCE